MRRRACRPDFHRAVALLKRHDAIARTLDAARAHADTANAALSTLPAKFVAQINANDHLYPMSSFVQKVLADSGEDQIAYSDGSDYAAILHGPIVLAAKTGTESLDGLLAAQARQLPQQLALLVVHLRRRLDLDGDDQVAAGAVPQRQTTPLLGVSYGRSDNTSPSMIALTS